MGLLSREVFVCLDCETTGLDAEQDRIIEIAYVKFEGDQILESFETLIDPEQPIAEDSIKIHKITDNMVKGKPKIREVLPDFLQKIRGHIIVGHGIPMDIRFITEEAKRNNIPCTISNQYLFDTLRLARLYGESPSNSLETLRHHFNIEPEEAHRAMADVLVNVEVFRFLTQRFKTTEAILDRLKKPILLRAMPLGKHKGRPFSEIPVEYLIWALRKDFDQDLVFSIKEELKKRKTGNQFQQASNPFLNL